MFTTNESPRHWGAVLHDDDLSDAILDRLLERGRHLRLDGSSLRTKHLPSSDEAEDTQNSTQSRRISGIGAAGFTEPTAWMCA